MREVIVTDRGHRFDRRVPAPLAPHRMLYRAVSANLSPVVDLRPWDGATKDQGSEGSCTGHAGASTAEWIMRRYFPQFSSLVFSPQYLYEKELILNGDFPVDSGSDGLTLCHVMIQSGCCELAAASYVAGQISMPTAAQDENAAKHTMGAFHGLAGSATALSVLGDPTPWPVMVGFTCYSGLESEETACTGVLPMPNRGEPAIGGHEVKLSGYDIGAVASLRPTNCPPAVLVQNSWGTGWGLNGYFWMPLEYLDREDTDMKIVHTGKPW